MDIPTGRGLNREPSERDRLERGLTVTAQLEGPEVVPDILAHPDVH
jgi:hypothetical protein